LRRAFEVGLGSGYGAAVAREVVGSDGLVVSIEIDPVTFTFKAAGDGSALLRLKYWRSFEPDTAPLRTFEVNVTVETE
jgi:protein-L-isoaspartate O-methyltransferase